MAGCQYLQSQGGVTEQSEKRNDKNQPPKITSQQSHKFDTTNNK